MTHRYMAVLCLLSCLLISGVAHAASKAEVFAGYQFTRFDGGPNANGWNGAVTGKLNSFFGITADLSGTYGGGIHFYSYTFGPQLSLPMPILHPYAHVLFGGLRASAGGVSTTAFNTTIGGGLDMGGGPLAWRLAQVDWLVLHNNGFTDRKNVRISTGVVLRF